MAAATGNVWSATAIVGGGFLSAFAGLLPDIDAPGSLVTRGWLPGGKANMLIHLIGLIISIPFRIMGHIVHATFGHRGASHSLVFAALWGLLVALPVLAFQGPLWIIWAVILGYLGHMGSDATTKSGIPVFWPFTDKHYRFGLFFGLFTTGTPKETFLRVFLFWPLVFICYGTAIYLLVHSVAATTVLPAGF